jgi:hypothetical protein
VLAGNVLPQACRSRAAVHDRNPLTQGMFERVFPCISIAAARCDEVTL